MSPRCPVAFFALPVVLLASCSDDPVRPPEGDLTAAETSYQVSVERYSGEPAVVFGRAADDFYVGDREMLLHWNGRDWRPHPVPPGAEEVRGGWQLANGDIAVYGYRRLYRISGERWDYIALPEDWRQICGLPTGEAFASTRNGGMYYYDGGAWRETLVPGSPEMWGLHAAARDNVYAVGYHGLIAHFDGVSWTSANIDSTLDLYGVWCLRDQSVFVSDGYGSVYEFAGGTLTPVSFPAPFQADLMWGSDRDLYVFGIGPYGERLVQHTDGAGWTAVSVGIRGSVRAGWTAPSGEILIATWGDGLWRTDGAGSGRVLGGPDAYRNRIEALWSSPADGVFAVGYGAYRYDGSGWADLKKEELTDRAAAAVHGTDGRNLYVVGDRMILHYDGRSWDWVSSGFQTRLADVRVTPREVLAVGDYGTVVRYDGRAWEKMPVPTTRFLHAISGWDDGAVAVGEEGTILRYDGSTWEAEPSPVSWSLYDVTAFGPQRIIAVGDNPWQVLVRDSRGWSTRPIETYETSTGWGNWSTSVWGTFPADFYVAQYRGDIHHFDGRTWTRLPRVVASSMACITGTPTGDLFAATSSVLLRYRPPR